MRILFDTVLCFALKVYGMMKAYMLILREKIGRG
jgi:hypothetical protein